MAAFQYPGSATTDAPLDQLAERRAIALAARLLANAKQSRTTKNSFMIAKLPA